MKHFFQATKYLLAVMLGICILAGVNIVRYPAWYAGTVAVFWAIFFVLAGAIVIFTMGWISSKYRWTNKRFDDLPFDRFLSQRILGKKLRELDIHCFKTIRLKEKLQALSVEECIGALLVMFTNCSPDYILPNELFIKDKETIEGNTVTEVYLYPLENIKLTIKREFDSSVVTLMFDVDGYVVIKGLSF